MADTPGQQAEGPPPGDGRPIADTAERVLGAAIGGRVQLRLRDVVSDCRGAASTVLRYAIVAASAPAPDTVIVKCANSSPAALRREQATLAFLHEQEALRGLAPRCFGGDQATAILVLEDLHLPEHQRLGAILFGADPRTAEHSLTVVMRALGQLHATSAGREERYTAHCAAHTVAGNSSHPIHGLHTDLGDLPTLLTRLGVAVSPAVTQDVQAAIAALMPPLPFPAFVHGDATPANAFITPVGVRLLDWEASAYRPALLDGAFARLRYIFSVWARAIPLDVQRQMETAYRTALAQGFPQAADDDRYHDALIAAAAAWVAGFCARLPMVLTDDRRWGRATWRQRIVAGLEHFVVLAQETGRLPALAETVQLLGAQLRTRWPVEDGVLPPYPAFAPGHR